MSYYPPPAPPAVPPSAPPPALPPAPSLTSVAGPIILKYEGLDQPQTTILGDSGLTIGIGYDMGYEENFALDWQSDMPARWKDRLSVMIGRKGDNARRVQAMNYRFPGIVISRSSAEHVFYTSTLPKYTKMTEDALPGILALPVLVQAVLVSLVYVRGAGFTDSRNPAHPHSRSEMRDVRDAVARGDLVSIAASLAAMARLWVGTNEPGNATRVISEAQMVLSAVSSKLA